MIALQLIFALLCLVLLVPSLLFALQVGLAVRMKVQADSWLALVAQVVAAGVLR